MLKAGFLPQQCVSQLFYCPIPAVRLEHKYSLFFPLGSILYPVSVSDSPYSGVIPFLCWHLHNDGSLLSILTAYIIPTPLEGLMEHWSSCRFSSLTVGVWFPRGRRNVQSRYTTTCSSTTWISPPVHEVIITDRMLNIFLWYLTMFTNLFEHVAV